MKTIKDNNITKLYKYLQLGGRYTTQELSTKFKLSPRTIQGFLKKLRENYGLKKEKKYYFFSDEYRHIDMDERVQMSTALMISLYKNAIPTIEESILQNFKEIPKEVDAFLFDIDFQEIQNETYFNQMTHAIIHQKAVRFRYKDTKEKISIKNVYPLKITNVLEYWYLMGYDLEQDKVKTYYFNNIKELIVHTDESYLSTKQIQKLSKKALQMHSPWFSDDKKRVQLRISGDAILYMQRKKGEMFSILHKQDDMLLVEMEYYNDIEVLNFVKKWLPFVDIVDNPLLKKKLHTILKKYLLK